MAGLTLNYTIMENNINTARIITKLIRKGVHIPNPDSVYISDDVNPDRISSDNVTLYAGTKIVGSRSLIMKNSRIGYEAPVTLENTLVGENTKLQGGFFKQAVLLGGNTFGSGAHVREGTILEEEANAAHAVGLKQTILFPFVTLGSLINFCDCFMAGGTSRKDHSEVGSSFVHFNYTPNQDKATPSMMGDVHQGVMLQSRPIFLGGQGGIVGPVRIAYGCISAAGSIIRKNELNENRLIISGGLKTFSLPRAMDVYSNVAHIFNNNLYYLGGLVALSSWYRHIRRLFISDEFSDLLFSGLLENLSNCIQERLHRFEIFCNKLNLSKENLMKKSRDKTVSSILIHDKAMETFEQVSNTIEKMLKTETINQDGEKFIKRIESKINRSNKNYIKTIKNLDTKERKTGTNWLQAIEINSIEKFLL